MKQPLRRWRFQVPGMSHLVSPPSVARVEGNGLHGRRGVSDEFDDSLLLSNTMRKKIMTILMMKVMMIIYDIVMTMMTLMVMMVMLAMAIMIRAMAMTILRSDDDVWTCRRQSLGALYTSTDFSIFFHPHRFF